MADLDIRLLRVFMAVAEENGFAGAKSRLNLAPSTLSEQIKDLEYRLGFAVCLRGRKGFRLTEQGKGLLEASRTLFTHLEMFRNQVSTLSNRLSGAIRLGLTDGLVTERRLPMSDVIRRFRETSPSVAVHVSVEPPPDLEIGLLDGAFDMVVGPFPVHKSGLVYERLFVERQSLYCGRGNRFFDIDPRLIAAAHLTDAPFVTYDYAGQTGLGPFADTTVVRSLEAATMLILSGGFVGFLPRHAARRQVDEGVLWEIDEDRFACDSAFSLATRNATVQDPAQKAFARLLLSTVQRA
ncbi:MAG: LysR family transcriptional regulator [Parvibaculaceae bacterium]